MNRTARKRIVLSVIGVLGLLLCVNMAMAQVPPYIAYQGMLTQAGTPVQGTKTITLGLYNAENGGTSVWGTTTDVSFAQGVFSTMLGPLDTNIAQQGLWLQITIDGSPLSPRQRIVSALYSFYADRAGTATYAEMAGSMVGTVNYAGTASYAVQAGTASYAGQASQANTATYANQAGLAGTATYTNKAGTATYAEMAGGAVGTASYARTASYAVQANTATMALDSYDSQKLQGKTAAQLEVGTASYATTAGYALTASTATMALQAGTATYAGTASYALSASHHYIGESYGGGIVFYVYDNGQHGLIAATADQSTGIQWYNGTYRYTGSLGDGVNAGAMNTAMIVSTQIGDNQTGNFAAKVCAEYSVTGADGVIYGDWYLPSKYELQLLYNIVLLQPET